jgi:DNA-binding PadR family transcriptional regulator
LKQISADVLHVSDGSLYPALHKLEQEGLIIAEWKVSELGRRAKFYSLTPIGLQELSKESENWERLSQAITAVVRLTPA